jgi:hypothetical protein
MAFDPATAKPFDPASAKPVGAAGASAKAAPKKDSGILSQIGSAAKNIAMAPIEGVKSIVGETLKEGRENAEAIKGDFTATVQSHDKAGKPGKPGVMDYAARAGTTALDLVNRPFIPVTAAIRQTVGRSANELTGGKLDPDAVTNAAMIALPASKSKTVAALGGAVEDGIGVLEKLFSPTTVSKEAGAAERTIRRAGGEQSLIHEKIADKLVEHNKTLANMPVAQQRALIDDIENGRTPTDPKLAAAAKDIRGAYDTWRNRIIQVLPKSAVPNFINDYYAHIWTENPSIVSQKMGAFSKQGSGRSFKQRTIPTISDGIKAGLTPKFENPVEATTAYSQNMSRFIATHDMQGELKAQGYAKWYTPGSKNIPPGWVPLDGILTEKTAPTTPKVPAGSNTGKPVLSTGRPIKLYAPPDVARVYNNFISKGFSGTEAAPVYDVARKVANGMTQMKLGLSAFHLANIANESVISDYARAFRAASRGEAKTALRAAGSALANTATGGAKSYMRGMKMQREFLDQAMPDRMSKVVNDAFVKSGGTLRMDPFYRSRASGSFFNAIEKGTFKAALKQAAQQMYKGNMLENAKGVIDNISNVMQTMTAPLFEKYIPAVKRGAFASEMEDFLKAKPNATQAEIDKQALLIQDSIDNRFGELNQDNLFWNKYMKQASQLMLLAPTWDLGTLREIGGGLKDFAGGIPDLAKGEGLSRRSAYVAGLVAQTALMSAVYQYLKTGKGPESVKDLMTPQTGGTVPGSNQPERALLPGYQKDVYAFGYDFPFNVLQEGANKLNPGLQTVTDYAANKDYRGFPIVKPEGARDIPGQPTLMDDFINRIMPIGIQQMGQAKKGSQIGGVQRFMGVRPAPSYMQDPAKVEANKAKYGTQDWKKRIRADQRQKANQQ